MKHEEDQESLRRFFRTGSCAVHAVSLRGTSHERNNMPMQDSWAAAELENGWIVMAVADGVGSEPRADEGARIAATAAVDHVRRFWGCRVDDRSMENMMRAAYHAASAAIFAQARANRTPMREYSTTLHMVIFSDGLIYIMHAGDGGIAILTEEGQIMRLTTPMKGPDGESVVPLQGGRKAWRFSVCRERAQSVLLATDGFWDKLCPPVLKAYGDAAGVEKGIAGYFMNPWGRDWKNEPLEAIAEKEAGLFRGEPGQAAAEFRATFGAALAQGETDGEILEEAKEKAAAGQMQIRLLQGIQDDITVLTLVRFDPMPRRVPLEQLMPPDWEKIGRWVQGRLSGATTEAEPPETGGDSPAEKESGAAADGAGASLPETVHPPEQA